MSDQLPLGFERITAAILESRQSPRKAHKARRVDCPGQSDQAKRERLHRAALRVLGRLQRGPVTNLELVSVGGVRYGARIHELRQAGHKIRCDEDKASGWAVYTLEGVE